MQQTPRWIVAWSVLVIGALGYLALRGHALAAGRLEPVALARPLAEFPLELGAWRGQDRPMEGTLAFQPDDQLQRVYLEPATRRAVLIWMVYSAEGADRGHHPEVCMAVAGKPEDATARRAIPIDGHPIPVQQFVFGHEPERQRVFYWHYTLPSPRDAHSTRLQRLYQRLSRRPASLTIEVFAEEGGSDESPDAVLDFVRELDRAAQAQVGPGAIRGSHRLPITAIDGSTFVPESEPTGG